MAVTLPGDYSVPGMTWPGSWWPGETATAPAGTLLSFTGLNVLTYPQYLDAVTQKTLVASPGGAYYVIATGPAAPIPTDGRWMLE